jgi:hypothetical protein
LREPLPLFPGSSAVEQPAVNRLVAGSNPARGAKPDQALRAKSSESKSTQNTDLAAYLAAICKAGPPSPQNRTSGLLWPGAGRPTAGMPWQRAGDKLIAA